MSNKSITIRVIMRNLVLAVVMLLNAGCGDQQTPTGPSGGGVRVSGRVLDFATNLGVPGATVAFGDTPAVTDASGSYVVVVPIFGRYYPLVDGGPMGWSQVTGPTYRGDFLVRPGTCVSRYGTLTDATTLRPVAGATVSLSGRDIISEIDGWYRIDLGCPANGLFGFNTTFMYVSHPNYVDQSQVVGRGVFGVSRVDLELQRR